MDNENSSSFDVYMAKLRQAKESLQTERTEEQKNLLNSLRNGPTYNSLFKQEFPDTENKSL